MLPFYFSCVLALRSCSLIAFIFLFGYLIIATIPVVLAGFFLKNYYPNGIRNITIVGWSTLGFGILLFIADRIGMTIRRIEHIKGVDALLIGLAQILALIPGTSRSGITITVARLTGMERPSAARFSMLLGIPTIIAAGALEAVDDGVELKHDDDKDNQAESRHPHGK